MTSTKKHIVLITTWFPPIQGVAVNRMWAFAKYFDKSKFDVTVLTLLDENGILQEEVDGCLVKRLPNKRLIQLPKFKSSDKKFKHYFKVALKLTLLKTQKDIYHSWRNNVLAELTRLHPTKNIDVIISSFSPEAAHVVACEFCEKYPSIKWIADMRDEMSQNPTISKSDKRKYIKIENRISRRVNAITTVSKPLVELFHATTMSNVKELVEIRNGFDNELINCDTSYNSVFTITYCGIFYGANKPEIFFSAMSELEIENKLKGDWKIIFVGTSQSILIPEKFKTKVVFVDQVNQAKSLEYMQQSDVNLLMLPKSERVGVYSGKLFDYLSVRKPILAIANKNDVAAELILKLNAGFVAANDNLIEVKETILKSYILWKEKKKLEMDEVGISKLHRKFQVEKLSELIERLVNEK